MNLFNHLKIDKLVYREKILPVCLPILEIFKRLYNHYEQVFFLESLGEDAVFARYSYIGFGPKAVLQAKNGVFTIDGQVVKTVNPYETLKAIKKIFLPRDHFGGGLVGYISYEGVRYFDDLPFLSTDGIFPDFEFGLYLDGLFFCRKTNELKYFYCLEDRSQEVMKFLKKNSLVDDFKINYIGANSRQADFEKMVLKAREHILAGDSFQVVLSRRHNFKIKSGNSLFFYERLRELNPSPHMFYLKFGERELVGSSPELIVRLENNVIQNFPLAGTTKRGESEEVDQKLAQELLHDAKERAEHLMLVDLGRNDVGQVSRFGSVEVKKLMAIKRFSHVQHIGSEIKGNLAQTKDMFDVLKANSPMGTVAGAPKIETMKIINQLETEARGPYAGSIGYFGFNNSCNFAVGIRSFFRSGSMAYLQSGAGVVYDSVPAREFLETQRKSQALVYALTGEDKIW